MHKAWDDDDDVQLIIVKDANGKAFCVGCRRRCKTIKGNQIVIVVNIP